MAGAQDLPVVDVRAIRTAKTLIERHGDGALAFSETQAERLSKDGCQESADEWKAVGAAIRQLTAGLRRR